MIQRFRAGCALVFAVLSLTLSPVAPAMAADDGGLNIVAPDRGFQRVWRAYPDMDARFARTGSLRSLDQVRRVAIGQGKQQLQSAIGRPVVGYPDGSWEYSLSLPLRGKDRLVCQYRVYFDDADLVRATVWRRPQCAGLVTGKGQ